MDEEEEEFARFTVQRGQAGELYPWEPEDQDFEALAAVIRGARNAVVSDADISTIRTPALIAFGENELDHLAEPQKRRLSKLPETIRVLVVEGRDHDSENAAILSAEFTQAVRDLIASNPIR